MKQPGIILTKQSRLGRTRKTKNDLEQPRINSKLVEQSKASSLVGRATTLIVIGNGS